jgi:citrate lyase subunit beta / citryl-CoA lyase
MNLRSILFIPGDSEKKLAKADDFAADALVLDLEDSVAPSRKPLAREMVRDFLAARPGKRKSQLWIRINPLDHPDVLEDLVATASGTPDCIMQPKTNGPEDVLRLSHYLDVLEAREGLAPGRIKVHSIATETAVAMFTLGAYAEAKLPRLVSMNWGAEDLSSAIGAAGSKGADGDWDFPYQIVRTQFLFAAHAAGVQAIDTLYADYKDEGGLRRSCDLARRQGFTGRIAIHPAQVNVINESFSPSAEDVAQARRLVAAFAAAPDAGTIGLDGKMYDIPHLNQAKHVLAMHEAYASG